MSEGECSREEQETFQAEKQVKMSDLRKRIAVLEAEVIQLKGAGIGSCYHELYIKSADRVKELEAELTNWKDMGGGNRTHNSVKSL